MPLARTALYAQGEDLHVALWPGSVRNTEHITRFIARESRSYVLSVCGLLRQDDIPDAIPFADVLRARLPAMPGEGGTCLAGPDGAWLVEPVAHAEHLLVATLDLRRVREERQNFDPVGHYGRPDVLQLTVNRERQATARFVD